VLCAAFLLLQFGFEIFGAKKLARKAAHKILMTLTTGINFTNMFKAFTPAYPKSANRQSIHQCLLTLLGSAQKSCS